MLQTSASFYIRLLGLIFSRRIPLKT